VIDPDVALAAKSDQTWDQWHRIFGHLNMASVKMLKSKGMMKGMDVNKMIPPMLQCNAWIQVKQHVTSLPKESNTIFNKIREMTLTNLWGPAQTNGIWGEHYYIVFNDGKA
jgi:hypothetical protein